LRPAAPELTQPKRQESGGQAAGIRWAVIRALDLDTNAITVQQVRMSDPEDSTTAVAFGSELTGRPIPGYTTAMYNVPGAIIPTPEVPEDEELGINFVAVRLNPDMTVEFVLKLIENPTDTDPHQEEV
jgi:hypothetical protein